MPQKMMIMTPATKSLVRSALAEDICSGDITTQACVEASAQGRAILKTKQDLVLCGMDVVTEVLQQVDAEILLRRSYSDGEHISAGTVFADLRGKLASLLQAERTLLNFLQHLSGIATLTQQYAQALQGSSARLLDTRKTMPGLRELEKYAVKTGGGNNHRFGLYDRYLIKENHIAASGSLENALHKAKAHRGSKNLLIEIEVQNLAQAELAVSFGTDIIMCDNMSPALVKEVVQKVEGRAKIEVSGNINLKNIKEYAFAGVDFISVGSITHSAPAADVSMLIEA